MNRRGLLVVGALFVCLGPTTATALSSDASQPIELEADRVEIDEGQGISTYSGNVKLSQGSTKLSGDRIVVKSGRNGLEKLTAYGAPAAFRQRPDGEQQDVVAEANKMEHDVVSQKLTLTDNAKLNKGKERFSGAQLEYDMRKNTIKASSAKSASATGKKQRVQMVIQPKTASGGKKK